MKYIYPAVFYEEETGYSVLFPDFPCGTCGETLQEAYTMAVDFLYSQLDDMLTDKQELPRPTAMDEIVPATDFKYKSFFTSLIAVDLKEYAEHLKKSAKSVRKNITIPAWLSDIADAKHVNYSSVLQEALKEHLGV